MAHTYKWLIPDRLIEVTISGEIVSDDLTFLLTLGAQDRDLPPYLLVGYDHVKLSVPPDALQVLGKAQPAGSIPGYIAIWGAPAVIELFSKLVVKVGHWRNLVGFFPTRAKALEKIFEMMERVP